MTTTPRPPDPTPSTRPYAGSCWSVWRLLSVAGLGQSLGDEDLDPGLLLAHRRPEDQSSPAWMAYDAAPVREV